MLARFLERSPASAAAAAQAAEEDARRVGLLEGRNAPLSRKRLDGARVDPDGALGDTLGCVRFRSGRPVVLLHSGLFGHEYVLERTRLDAYLDRHALRKPVKVQGDAKALAEKAWSVVAEAKDAYRAALAPYREACRKAGVECEYEGGRSANVSEKVSFLVEKTDKGVRVTVKGQPKTEEVIPLAAIKESVNKAAYAYTDKHLGPKEKIGNKGGSLSNRLRAAIA